MLPRKFKCASVLLTLIPPPHRFFSYRFFSARLLFLYVIAGGDGGSVALLKTATEDNSSLLDINLLMAGVFHILETIRGQYTKLELKHEWMMASLAAQW